MEKDKKPLKLEYTARKGLTDDDNEDNYYCTRAICTNCGFDNHFIYFYRGVHVSNHNCYKCDCKGLVLFK